MFTGLIQAVSQVTQVEPLDNGVRISIALPAVFTDLALGESIALNGACMTVVDFNTAEFSVEVSHESLSKTTLGKLVPDSVVNCERALLPTERLGGHFVTGHVDSVAEVVSVVNNGMAWDFVFDFITQELRPYFIPKGSVAIDGISLTVNWVEGSQFGVTIIPHTWEATTVQYLKAGSRVNIETDMLGKYVLQQVKQLSPQP